MDLPFPRRAAGPAGLFHARGAGFYYLSHIETVAGTLAAILLLLLPGSLLIGRDEWEHADPIELVAVAFAGSAAIWAVSFWFLRFAPISWRGFALGMASAAMLVLILRRRAGICRAAAGWRKAPLSAWAGMGFVLLLLALRLVFAATHVAYSGGDMTAHAALSEEIVMADGFPQTQEPLLPIPRFGEIAPGFHALAALVTLLSGLPTFRSTMYILCLAAAGATPGLYVLLRALGLARSPSAAGAAGALLYARNPQFFLQWGGAPSVLAAMIGLVLLRDLAGLGESRRPGRAGRAGLLAAGVLLVHPLIALGLLWIGPPLLLLRRASGHGHWRLLVRDLVLAASAAFALSLPFLAVAAHPPSPEMTSWARVWFAAETRGAALIGNRFPLIEHTLGGLSTWLFFLVAYLGALPVVLMFGGLAAGLAGPRRQACGVGILILAAQALLFAGALGEFLPGWPGLYPGRIGVWLAVPLAVAVAEIAARILHAAGRRVVLLLGVLLLAFCWEGWRLSSSPFGIAFYAQARDGRSSPASLLANEAAGGAFWVTTYCSDVAAATGEDVSALQWVRDHTPPQAVFANNPGDGGGLLPAIAHRKILDPHYYWFFDRKDFEAWRRTARPGYVFVGARPAPAWQRRWTAETLDHDPRVEVAHTSGRARVYRIREGFADSFR